MDDDRLTDETVAWPSYVDFLCTFAFVLLLFVGSLLYLLTGEFAQQDFVKRMGPFQDQLRGAGIVSWLQNRQLKVSLENQVVFRSTGDNMDKIESKYVPRLKEVGRWIARAPLPRRIIIEGHADSQPFENDPFGNWDLSARRGLAVLRFYYVCRDCGYGDDVRSRLTLSGEGDTSANKTIRDNPAERRVDVILDYRDDTSR